MNKTIKMNNQELEFVKNDIEYLIEKSYTYGIKTKCKNTIVITDSKDKTEYIITIQKIK